MELHHFFQPASYSRDIQQLLPYSETLLSQIKVLNNTKDWELLDNFDIAIIGVGEERGTPNKGTARAASAVRNQFEELSCIGELKIADLGDLNTGETHKDTLKGLEIVAEALFEKEILPIIIGGGNELLCPIVSAAVKHKQQLSIALVDPRLDIISKQKQLNANNYLHSVVLQQLDSIYNISNIGLQTYYNSPQAIKLYEDLYFDIHRLGTARSNIPNLEPIFRDSHLISFDMTAIRQSDSPGHKRPSVNGFFAEEACQITKYAGLSDLVSFLGIFEYNPVFDNHSQSAALVAQLIWHFIQGVSQRQNDFPSSHVKHYTKFIVQVEDAEQELIFHKNTKNGRWWAEVPYKVNEINNNKIVSCTEEDYQLAAANQIPDLWWKTLQKLNQRKS